ncbi:MAG TPA: TlpA disulfide reductase family protein [Kofleriaceae bacterium]|nr:TlpA disulfide reductase family protein [Kofleriaceae bacterium]
MSRRCFAVVLATAVALGGCGAQATPRSERSPSADDILAAMVAAYRGAHAYADRGEQLDGAGKRRTFETAFERPDRFRFEERDDGDPARAYVISSSRSGVVTRWYVRPDVVERDADLADAIGAAAGISGGTSYLIPGLLLPGVSGGDTIAMLDDGHVEGIEAIGGHPCWRISGRRHARDAVTLWIDRDRHLLRRIAIRRRVAPIDSTAPFDVVSTTTYDPVLAVSEEQLRGPELAGAAYVERDRSQHGALEPSPDGLALARALVGKPAPRFAELADRAGHVVIVDFWATWCRPCVAAVAELDDLQQRYERRGLRVIGVSSEAPAEVTRFTSDHPIAYALVRDDGDQVAAAYRVGALPMLVVIDRAGIVRHVDVGSGDFTSVEAVVVDLLSAP